MANITPGWTKTPNELLEAMPDMEKAELKLTAVLVRMTYGYHKDAVKMTYDDMMEATHLSRGGVSNAIDAVCKRGFFRRERKSTWCVNSLLSRLNEQDEIVQSVDQNSTVYRPKSIDQSLLNRLPSLYKEKESKEIKENIYIHPDPDPINRLITAVAIISKETCWAKTENDFTEAAHTLLGWDATPETVKQFNDAWKSNPDYPGKPALKTIINDYRNWLDGSWPQPKKPSKNGNTQTPVPAAADLVSNGKGW